MSGLNLSRRRSGVDSFELLGKPPKYGSAEPGGEKVPEVFVGGLLGPGPTARRGMGCILTRLAVCVVAPDCAIPSPVSLPL